MLYCLDQNVINEIAERKSNRHVISYDVIRYISTEPTWSFETILSSHKFSSLLSNKNGIAIDTLLPSSGCIIVMQSPSNFQTHDKSGLNLLLFV